jgi:predicted transcriptional regulator
VTTSVVAHWPHIDWGEFPAMARMPDAALTAVQFEIMQAVWERPAGAQVAEIWDAVAQGRDVGRTTVLNLVGRLEKRGWLKRRKIDGVYRYFATVKRDAAEAGVAGKFVNDFFGGSAKDLVMSLLGAQQISADEIAELRRLLDQTREPF